MKYSICYLITEQHLTGKSRFERWVQASTKELGFILVAAELSAEKRSIMCIEYVCMNRVE